MAIDQSCPNDPMGRLKFDTESQKSVNCLFICLSIKESRHHTILHFQVETEPALTYRGLLTVTESRSG